MKFNEKDNTVIVTVSPKEKANYLVEEFYDLQLNPPSLKVAKQSALLAVDEIMLLAVWTDSKIYDYWNEVKQEIEKL